MSEQKNNNNLKKDGFPSQIEGNKSSLLNLSNELTDNKQLNFIDNEDKEDEIKELNKNIQQNGIDLLKQK
jgi:hypothetical protein